MVIESDFVDVRGVRTRYLHRGSAGPVVILLHGAGTDSAVLSWQLAIESLARTCRVIAPDLPGYGESDCPKVDYSNAFYRRFVTGFMDALAIPAARIVGFSLGGAIALDLCLSAPQRVQMLVLVDSFGLQASLPQHKLVYCLTRIPALTELLCTMLRRSDLMARAATSAIVYDENALDHSLIEVIEREARRPAAGRAFHSYQKSIVQWNGIGAYFMPRLGQIGIPTLIVHGAEDALVPLSCAEEAHRRIHGSQLHVIARCGHWPQREHPDEFNGILNAFLCP